MSQGVSGSRDGGRIACLRCGANNFWGQTQCWRCQASLPPPEVQISPSPASTPSPVRSAFAPPSPSPWGLRLLMAVVAVAAGLIVLLMFGRSHPPATSLRTPDSLSANPAAETMRRPAPRPDAMPAASTPATEDAVEAEARRTVERARRDLHLPPAPGSLDTRSMDGEGRLRLRNGATVRQKEWEEAQRKALTSPLLREVPPLSPF